MASLSRADEIAGKSFAAAFASAVVGGALVTLLSLLLEAVDQVLSRMVVAFIVGFLLALAPFAHVVVTAHHLLFGVFGEAAIGFGEISTDVLIAIAGNMVGGLLFVTLAHIGQARAERS